MKKILFVFFLICLVSPFLHAQKGKNEPVIIIIGGDGNGNGGPIKRAPALIPIQATYYPSLSTLLVNFIYDMGPVAFEIKNLITGESILSNVNATQGVYPFLLSNVAGDYVIIFTLPNGRVFSGAFVIE